MRKILSSLFITFLLASCGGGGGGGDGESNSSTPEALVSHLGVWSNCLDYDSNSDTVNDSSILSLLSIGESSTSLQSTQYNSVGCGAGQEEYRVSSTTSYTRSGSTYSTVLKNETYVSLTAGDVTWNNTNSWCGLSNWVINVPQTSIGLTCGGESPSFGDTSSATVTRTGDSLFDGTTTYNLELSTDFTPAGQTIQNGAYAYSDGAAVAILAIFNLGSYAVYKYDIANRLYNIETGTYTSSNNVVNFTVTSSNPVGCNSGSASRRFASGSLAITMEFVAEGLILIAPKVTYSEAQFRSAFLGGGFSLGCF